MAGKKIADRVELTEPVWVEIARAGEFLAIRETGETKKIDRAMLAEMAETWRAGATVEVREDPSHAASYLGPVAPNEIKRAVGYVQALRMSGDVLEAATAFTPSGEALWTQRAYGSRSLEAAKTKRPEYGDKAKWELTAWVFTNNPVVEGLAASLPPTKGKTMDLETLVAALALPAGSDSTAIVAAMNAEKSKTLALAQEVETLKASIAKADELRLALSAERDNAVVELWAEKALTAGKLTPAQKADPNFMALAANPAFRAYTDAQAPVVNLSTKPVGTQTAPEGKDDEKLVAEGLSLMPQYKNDAVALFAARPDIKAANMRIALGQEN